MPEARHGLSRRDVIKRTATIAGVAWAAPVVQSLAMPATAGSPPPYGECTQTVRFTQAYQGTRFRDRQLDYDECPPRGWNTADAVLGKNGRVAGLAGTVTVTWDYQGDKRKVLVQIPDGTFVRSATARGRRRKKSGQFECVELIAVPGAKGQYVGTVSRRRLARLSAVLCVT